MAQIFVQGAARMSFDGVALFAQDAAAVGTVFAFADQRVAFVQDDNNSYPDLIDGSANLVNKVPGTVRGQIQVSGVVQPDRRFDQFLNTGFGPRGGANGPSAAQLYPWFMNLVPFSGGTAVKATGIWWQSCRVYSAYADQGGQQMVFFTLNGIVYDPNNVLGAPTLATPGYVGTPGAGIAPFARCSFNNDAVSPTVYDYIRSFDWAVSNRLRTIPAIKDPANRIAAGCSPSPIAGALTLTQLKNPVQAIPMTQGTYPLDLLIPSGDGTHTLTLASSMSHDTQSSSLMPTDFATQAAAYTLFTGAGGQLLTGAGHPFIAAYA